MSKISIDIEGIKNGLQEIGYIISDVIERENNGYNWQIKFSNSDAIATIYDTNKKKNTVVNGRLDEGEGFSLKDIIDGLKCKEIQIDSLNSKIVKLINSRKEDYYYDFKREWVTDKKKGDLLHDIICLANNSENLEAYLIIGVMDDYSVCGVDEWKKTNDIYDWLGHIKFAGLKKPNITLKKIYYMYKKIDVLVIGQSIDVPFYIEEEYFGVHPYHIYTRVGDTNTPKNMNASYIDVEKLWKIHFSS